VTTSSSSATLSFCTAVLTFSDRWPQVNLDFPGQPFFNDGNADGIADLLQVGHARLPSLASDLEVLAGEAPSGLQNGLGAMASDAQALAKDPAPTSAAQSKQQVKTIEGVASVVQRDIKARNCLSKVKAANASAANSTNQSGVDNSGSSDQGRTEAAVALFVLLNLPLIRRIWRHSRRPTLNKEGSGFNGNLRRWKVQTITGKVLNVQRHSVISTSAGGPLLPGGYIPINSITTTTETIRLALAGGGQTDVPLVNFSASPTIGDVVTIGVGRKRSRAIPFAVLNHTTGGEITRAQNLFSLREGGTVRQLIFLFGLIFSSLISMFIAVFFGAPWLIVVWFGLIVTFALVVRRGGSLDMQPLWRRAKAELEPLSA
jgi:hypothetical protein